MKCQHLIRLAFAVLFAATVSGRAAVVQSPEQLLPSDTLAVVSVPDFDHLRQVTLSSPWGLFWQDAEMKPFREKFLHRWQTNVVEPLERELGVKFQEYIGLMHGQVTLAITRNGWDGTTNQSPAWLVLLDVKDNTNALTGQLAALRKKWVDAGKSLKTEKIRDIEFLNLLFAPNDLKKAMENAFPGLKEEKSTKDSPDKPGEKTGLYVGQSGSLLLLGSSTKDLEKVLVRQAGGLVPMLAAEPVFESCQPQLRGSTLLGWVNLQVILENVRRQLIAASAANPPKDPMAPRPEKVLSAAGLDGLKAAIFSFKETADGYFWEGTLRVPEASRKGLLRMLALETAEAQPAAFVPVDAVKFYRSRLDVQKAWAAIETALAEVSPELSGLVQMTLSSLKDQNPDLDFKKSLIGNLGNDIMTFQKKPRAATLAALNSAPTLTLLGSPNADALLKTVRQLVGLFPPPANDVKEQEFLGRKIYSLASPFPMAQGPEAESRLFFSASGGYLVFSPDVTLIEEYLRSGEKPGKSLREMTGLNEAAQRVGGMNTGLFGYENQLETMRVVWEVLKKEPGVFEQAFGLSPVMGRSDVKEASKDILEWLDFSLLPEFDKVSRYFHFSVYAGSARADGLSMRFFLPVPPQLKK